MLAAALTALGCRARRETVTFTAPGGARIELPSSPEAKAARAEASRAALKAGKPLMIVTSEGGEA